MQAAAEIFLSFIPRFLAKVKHLNHFHPKFVKSAILQAQKARAEAYKKDENKRTVLEVKPELLERLAKLQLLRSKFLHSRPCNMC